MVEICKIVQAVANELHIIDDKKFFRKWYSMVSYMMEVLEVITVDLSTGDLAMSDRQLNILSIVRWQLGSESMEKLKTKYEDTPDNEIEYVSFLSYVISFCIITFMWFLLLYISCAICRNTELMAQKRF